MEDNISTDLSGTHNFDLASFTRAHKKMIATNERAYRSAWGTNRNLSGAKDYTLREVEEIISSGSLEAQQKLSRYYFKKDGYYRQIIIHYATLLKYVGLLIPTPSSGKKLSTSHIQKRYYSAMDYVECMQLPVFLTNVAYRALIDGSYYGFRVGNDKDSFQVIDLPYGYARSRFKDMQGNDVVEFDVSYFGTITDEKQRKAALSVYPKVVQKAWKKFEGKNLKSKWVIIPSDTGICFPFFEGHPILLNIIPATIEYDEAIAAHREREAEEIRKIIVQKIPHLSDGRLLFEPEEAEEMHNGTVGMLSGNKNLSVLTTYGDVEAITSSIVEGRVETLTRIEQNIYSKGGVSKEIFAPTGSSAVKYSLDNDTALMMYLANKFSRYISNLLNELFSNSNISFKYTIMPITHHNYLDYGNASFKLVGSGYSALMPALAFGFSQRDLTSIKELENEVLKLGEKLIPLSTSYTQSNSQPKDGGNNSGDGGDAKKDLEDPNAGEAGRPELKEEDKSDKTRKNEESIDKTGGGS